MIPFSSTSVTGNYNACGTHSDNLRSNEGERGLRDDTPPSDEPTGDSRDSVVLNERPGIFPVTESDSKIGVSIFDILFGVKSCCLSWFGPPPRSRTIPRIMRPTMVMTLMELRCSGIESVGQRNGFNTTFTHAKMNSASPYAPKNFW